MKRETYIKKNNGQQLEVTKAVAAEAEISHRDQN